MFPDFSAQNLLLLAGLYLATGLVMVATVAVIPHGKSPNPSIVITWPFVLLLGLLGLIGFILRSFLRPS